MDSDSAYENIQVDRQAEAEAAEQAKAEAEAARQKAKEEKARKNSTKPSSRKKTSTGKRVANSALNAVGREAGKSFYRGLFGTLKKWF